jgi:hypothetical protein
MMPTPALSRSRQASLPESAAPIVGVAVDVAQLSLFSFVDGETLDRVFFEYTFNQKARSLPTYSRGIVSQRFQLRVRIHNGRVRMGVVGPNNVGNFFRVFAHHINHTTVPGKQGNLQTPIVGHDDRLASDQFDAQ